MYLRFPLFNWTLVTVAFALTFAVLSVSVPWPAAGSVTIFTLDSESPLSVSEKLKSVAAKA